MGVEQTIYELLIRGNKEVADGYNSVSDALKKNNDALEENKKKADEGSQKLGNLAGAMGPVNSAVGALNPQLGALTQTMSGAVSQTQGLGQSMGSMGVAMGVAGGAIALLLRDMDEMQKRQADEARILREEIDLRTQHIASVHEEVAAIEARARSAAQDEAIARRVQQGTASLTETQAYYHTLLERQVHISQAAHEANIQLEYDLDQAAHSGSAAAGEIDHLNTEIARTAREAAAADAEIRRLTAANREATRVAREAAGAFQAQAAAILQAEKAKEARGRAQIAAERRSGGRGGGFRADMTITSEDLAGFEQRQLEALELPDSGASSDLSDLAEDRGPQTSGVRGRGTSAKDAAELARKAEKQRHDEAMQHMQQELQQWQAFGSALGGVFEAIAGAQGKSAEAQKRAAVITLVGQGTTEAIAGAIDLATAIGSTVENPVLAATKFLSSGMHIANSVRAFAQAGEGGGAGATSGGGGGGGAGAVRPTNQTQSQGGGGGGQIIFNLNGPMVAAGSAVEGGRMFGNMLRSAIGARGSDRLGLPL